MAANEAAPGLAFRPLTLTERAERPDRPGRDEVRADGPVLQVLVNDFPAAIDEVWRAGCHSVAGYRLHDIRTSQFDAAGDKRPVPVPVEVQSG